jgi:hypothetical protein
MLDARPVFTTDAGSLIGQMDRTYVPDTRATTTSRAACPQQKEDMHACGEC